MAAAAAKRELDAVRLELSATQKTLADTKAECDKLLQIASDQKEQMAEMKLSMDAAWIAVRRLQGELEGHKVASETLQRENREQKNALEEQRNGIRDLEQTISVRNVHIQRLQEDLHAKEMQYNSLLEAFKTATEQRINDTNDVMFQFGKASEALNLALNQQLERKEEEGERKPQMSQEVANRFIDLLGQIQDMVIRHRANVWRLLGKQNLMETDNPEGALAKWQKSPLEMSGELLKAAETISDDPNLKGQLTTGLTALQKWLLSLGEFLQTLPDVKKLQAAYEDSQRQLFLQRSDNGIAQAVATDNRVRKLESELKTAHEQLVQFRDTYQSQQAKVVDTATELIAKLTSEGDWKERVMAELKRAAAQKQKDDLEISSAHAVALELDAKLRSAGEEVKSLTTQLEAVKKALANAERLLKEEEPKLLLLPVRSNVQQQPATKIDNWSTLTTQLRSASHRGALLISVPLVKDLVSEAQKASVELDNKWIGSIINVVVRGDPFIMTGPRLITQQTAEVLIRTLLNLHTVLRQTIRTSKLKRAAKLWSIDHWNVRVAPTSVDVNPAWDGQLRSALLRLCSDRPWAQVLTRVMGEYFDCRYPLFHQAVYYLSRHTNRRTIALEVGGKWTVNDAQVAEAIDHIVWVYRIFTDWASFSGPPNFTSFGDRETLNRCQCVLEEVVREAKKMQLSSEMPPAKAPVDQVLFDKDADVKSRRQEQNVLVARENVLWTFDEAEWRLVAATSMFH